MPTFPLKQYELAEKADRSRSSKHRAYSAEVSKRVELAKAQANCGTFPVDVARLARHVGIVAIREVPLAMRGRLLREPGGFTVEVSSELARSEREFVKAHEIAHVLIERDLLLSAPQRSNRSSVTGGLPYRFVEKLCDLGAAEILLPAAYLRGRVRRIPPDLAVVKQIAAEGQLAIDFVAARICDAAVWKCRFVWWVQMEGQLAAAKSLPECPKETLVQIELIDDANSLVAKAMQCDEVLSGIEPMRFWEGTTAYEAQCIRLSERSALSLLIYP